MHPYPFLSLLFMLVVCNHDAVSRESCISEYTAFEEGTFKNNSRNRHELYKAFYPPNGHLPFSVKVNYQSASPNGTTKLLLTNASGYINDEWIWLSSPVFYFVRPEYLNEATLWTLNYFRSWHPPYVTLEVPLPCLDVSFQFLLEMTTSLQDYALGDLQHKTHSGFVMIHSTAQHSFYRLPLNSSDAQSGTTMNGYYASLVLVVTGLILQIFVVWVAIIAGIKRHLKEYVEKSHLYSYNDYGVVCGGTMVSFLLALVIIYSYISNANRVFPEGADTAPYALYLSGIGLLILPGIPTAIYFTCTSKPPAIPSIFYMPVSIISCCNTRYGKSLVFAAGLFALTVSLQCFSVTAMLTTFVAFAEPFAIITNSLVVVLLVFCLVNYVALIFTISAYVFTPKGHQTEGGKFVIARKAFIVIPLLAMVCCYCAVLGAGGYTVNVDTKQGSMRSILGSLTVPVILGATTFGLKKLITKSLDRSNVNEQPNNSEGKEESHESYTSMLHDDDQLLDP